MSGWPMICSATLNSQLSLVVQSAEAGGMQPDAERSSALAHGEPPSAQPSLDLDEWLLSDVVWDPFDMVRSRLLACAAVRCRQHLSPKDLRFRRLSRPTTATAWASKVAHARRCHHRSRFCCPSSPSARGRPHLSLPHADWRAACRRAPRLSSR